MNDVTETKMELREAVARAIGQSQAREVDYDTAADAAIATVIAAVVTALEDDARLCDCAAHGSHECACGAWDDYKTITCERAVEIVRRAAFLADKGDVICK